ncbi:MAG: hypothetical protein CFE21_05685 [Bacteroidetes bacterium B1(2017)]|nr:MAG: hypothetical protein CFE21_05685 [Bacteroidetes bacterium B1(2017)]
MYSSINILILEDELIIAQDLVEILNELNYQEVFMARNYEQAIALLEQHTIDLALLDINLKAAKTGVDVAHQLRLKYNIPFIFVTSYSDNDTIQDVKQTKPSGFLIKPYTKELVLASVEIALFNFANRNHPEEFVASNSEFSELESSPIVNGYLLIKEKYRFVKVAVADIYWLVSDKNYVEIITQDRRYIVRNSLKKLMEQLPSENFIKCHKQYIVNLKFVSSFTPNSLFVNEVEIPISRSTQEEVLNLLIKSN